MRTLIVSLLVAATALAQQGRDPEAEIKKAVSAAIADLADYCRQKKLLAEGRDHLQQALAYDADNAKAKALAGKLDGDGGEISDSLRKDYAKRLESTGRKVAGLLKQLFAQKHDPKDQARFDGYLVDAARWDAKGAGPVLDAEWRAAYQKKDYGRAHRLISAAEEVASDPARAQVLREIEVRASSAKPIQKTATTHAMKYYLSLPKNWEPGKSYPILVAVEGAGCAFFNICNGYANARGDRGLIIVAPITFSNTNGLNASKYPYPQELLDEADRTGRMKFDEPGLLAVLEDVRKEYGGEEKFFITGFSGGGNLCWRMTFGHPEMLRGSAPACANFYDPGPISSAPERESLPIKAFQGDKDGFLNKPPNLAAQWDMAKRLLDEKGFKNVSYVMLPGVGHAACTKEVIGFIDEVLGAK